jgi:hypothetical protein
VWFESEAGEDFLRGLNFFRQYVEEYAGAFGAEDEATAIVVKFNRQVLTGCRKGLFDG